MDQDDSWLIGFLTKPTAYNIEQTTAAVLGSAAYHVEVWTGASWDQIRFMMAESGNSWTQYAESLLVRSAVDENMRLDIDGTEWSAWAAHDPMTLGTDYYWLRIRNHGAAVTTSPDIERVKCGSHWSEFKSVGRELFGDAAELRTIPLETYALDGQAPADGDAHLSTSIDLNITNNEFANSTVDGFGGEIEIPEGLDTSRGVTFRFRWFVVGASTGDVEFEFGEAPFQLGDDVNSGSLAETLQASIQTVGIASDGILQEVSFVADVSALTPGDSLGWALWRDATAGNADDTLAASVRILTKRAVATFWR
jgi:hypothetical protein